MGSAGMRLPLANVRGPDAEEGVREPRFRPNGAIPSFETGKAPDKLTRNIPS